MTFNEMLEASYTANRKKWIKSMTGGNITPEMAEDIVQLASLNAIEHQDSYDSSREFDDWFYGILANARITVINQERNGGTVGRSL